MTIIQIWCFPWLGLAAEASGLRLQASVFKVRASTSQTIQAVHAVVVQGPVLQSSTSGLGGGGLLRLSGFRLWLLRLQLEVFRLEDWTSAFTLLALQLQAIQAFEGVFCKLQALASRIRQVLRKSSRVQRIRGRTLRGGRSRHLLETAFSEPLLRTPSENPSQNPSLL